MSSHYAGGGGGPGAYPPLPTSPLGPKGSSSPSLRNLSHSGQASPGKRAFGATVGGLDGLDGFALGGSAAGAEQEGQGVKRLGIVVRAGRGDCPTAMPRTASGELSQSFGQVSLEGSEGGGLGSRTSSGLLAGAAGGSSRGNASSTTGTLHSPLLAGMAHSGSSGSLAAPLDGSTASTGCLSRVPSAPEVGRPLRKSASSTGFRRSRVDLTACEKERSRVSSKTDLASCDPSAATTTVLLERASDGMGPSDASSSSSSSALGPAVLQAMQQVWGAEGAYGSSAPAAAQPFPARAAPPKVALSFVFGAFSPQAPHSLSPACAHTRTPSLSPKPLLQATRGL